MGVFFTTPMAPQTPGMPLHSFELQLDLRQNSGSRRVAVLSRRDPVFALEPSPSSGFKMA